MARWMPASDAAPVTGEAGDHTPGAGAVGVGGGAGLAPRKKHRNRRKFNVGDSGTPCKTSYLYLDSGIRT